MVKKIGLFVLLFGFLLFVCKMAATHEFSKNKTQNVITKKEERKNEDKEQIMKITKQETPPPLPNPSPPQPNVIVEPPIIPQRHIPILMYHEISEYHGVGDKGLYVTPYNFKAQMLYLKQHGYTPITFDDLNVADTVQKPVIITFDDGYQNNMNAYSVFKELSDANYHFEGVIFVFANILDTSNGLTSQEIKEMSDSGFISIESHTMNHPSLVHTTDFKTELLDSRLKLEKITGKKINAFAYPGGEYNQQVIQEVKKYYTYAVTTKVGYADFHQPYELNRIAIYYNTNLNHFIIRLNTK